ncbi:MAG: fumarylacetoacetate hydrolase family protein [Anaerolineae bacterium]
MRVARALTEQGITYGVVVAEQFQPYAGSPFVAAAAWQPQGAALPLPTVKLLPPCEPSKIVCIGRNYVEHAAEHGVDVPSEPLIFLKPPSALIGLDDTIQLTRLSERVEHEGELVVVIGQRARYLTVDNALEVVFGYTCGNDVTARDLQRRDGQWSRAKGFDTFCPLGPWIETELNWQTAQVQCLVNDQIRQSGHTRDMVFGVPYLLAHISAVMTLEPGDIVMTGTPSGVGPLRAGDRVCVEISGIGRLENRVSD